MPQERPLRVGAESACMDVEAVFASYCEQNDFLTRFVCSMIAAPRLAVSSWIRPCEQAAVEVQSVPALPVPALPVVALPNVALLEEAASTKADVETVHHLTEAGKADAATVTSAVSIEAAEAEEAKKPVESKKKASSFLELLAQEDSLASPTVQAVASSAKVAAWLGVEGGSEQAENKSVTSGIGMGLSCNGKDWSMEVKGFGKAKQGLTVSNLLYGYDNEEEEEDGSNRERFKISGTGTMCYMNQLYTDEEEEEEREALRTLGISVGIGRFVDRRRITGSSSRVLFRRISGAFRQY
ncbi:unnamed protein product [Closterium sp. Yama58-4]|nr:unnamed protein product [Closterium sp. Yama58-4]